MALGRYQLGSAQERRERSKCAASPLAPRIYARQSCPMPICAQQKVKEPTLTTREICRRSKSTAPLRKERCRSPRRWSILRIVRSATIVAFRRPTLASFTKPTVHRSFCQCKNIINGVYRVFSGIGEGFAMNCVEKSARRFRDGLNWE